MSRATLILACIPCVAFAFRFQKQQQDDPNKPTTMTIAAHRGASWVAPENTLVANRVAYEMGAAGVEFDVSRSVDGEVFMLHDNTLKRTANPKCPVELCGAGKMTQAEYSKKLTQDVTTLSYWDFIQYVDVGSWKGKQFADQRPALLRDAMAEVPKGFYVLLELKGKDKLLGKQAVDEALKYRWPSDRLKIIGFDVPLLTSVKTRLSAGGLDDVKVYLLKLSLTSLTSVRTIKTAVKHGLDGVDFLANHAVDSGVVKMAAKNGIKVGVWVNPKYPIATDTLKNALRMERRGVEFFTSDLPPQIETWIAAA